MSSESVVAFINDVEGRIQYFAKEHQLSYAEAIGCLEVLKAGLIQDVKDADKEEL